jgi:hypothetical protein
MISSHEAHTADAANTEMLAIAHNLSHCHAALAAIIQSMQLNPAYLSIMLHYM